MHGKCRDVEEIRECGYPVWAKGVCPRRSRNDFTFGTINEPIVITGVQIKKNDIIVADQSGVVCIPEELITKTLNLLKKISKQEEILEDQVLKNDVQDWDELWLQKKAPKPVSTYYLILFITLIFVEILINF